QNPELRHRFIGKPEDVTSFFLFIAEEVREFMAKLGFRTVNEMIGRTDKLEMRRGLNHPKARFLNLSRILYRPAVSPETAMHQCESQTHRLDAAPDHTLIAKAKGAIAKRKPVTIELPIRNTHRVVGAMLSGEIARRYGDEGLPDGSVLARFKGTAGQSFGAF